MQIYLIHDLVTIKICIRIVLTIAYLMFAKDNILVPCIFWANLYLDAQMPTCFIWHDDV